MRETLKSLSIFSAMLLLLLLISSGCDVNIPGCGKRSLPFFKKITAPTPVPVVPQPIQHAMNPVPALATPTQAPSSQIHNEMGTEMSVSKPKATFTFSPTPTMTPAEIEKIAYVTLEKNKPTIWTMNNDGTDRKRLTPVGTSSFFPLWSPSGKVLAFLSDMNDGKLNLFVVKKGEMACQQLTNYSEWVPANPKSLKPPFSWSPLSDEIAYAYKNQLWKVSVNSLVQTTLATFDPARPISAVEWAPHRENKYVAIFVKNGDRFFSLDLVNPRLMDQLLLDDSSKSLNDLSWTADARQVFYISDESSVYSASPNTSIPKIILQNASPELGPLIACKPTEGALAFLILAKKTSSDEGFRLAVLSKAAKDANDTGSLNFLTEPGVDDAVWSPDGSKIAYTQSGDLWVMDSATGDKKVRIAATGIESPSWSKK